LKSVKRSTSTDPLWRTVPSCKVSQLAKLTPEGTCLLQKVFERLETTWSNSLRMSLQDQDVSRMAEVTHSFQPGLCKEKALFGPETRAAV